jgi:hypothetical protein
MGLRKTSGGYLDSKETLLYWNLQEILAFATDIRFGADAAPSVLSVPPK